MPSPIGRRTLALLALVAGAPPAARAQSPVPSPAPPTAASVTLRQFAALRWLAGDWRGAGTDGTAQAPFYERYRFPDDSTLIVESFRDSTWRTVSETSRYELRGGRLGNVGSGARWVATRIDSLGAELGPAARARNAFRWERAAGAGRRPATWRATILPLGEPGATPSRYLMTRVR
jgi:hypothetical protein